VSLTAGSGPFSGRAAGRFNVEIDRSRATLFWDPVPQRIRALVAGEAIVDSRRARLLHETKHLPVYYFPEDDVNRELLEPSDRRTRCPHKGEARYWSIRVGERVASDAIWAYPEPIESAAFLAGHIAFEWDAVDEWFAEDAQLFGHPRDPYHRIDVYPSTGRVRVVVDGEVVAESTRAQVLFETGLPPRYYLPAEDVHTNLLVPSGKKTRCAYKGAASYWHIQVGGEMHDDLVWTYPEPQHDAEPVRDLLCFFNERVDLELDGRLEERPVTQWSRT
jgi:uncharacterized protein (DUF427 family)